MRFLIRTIYAAVSMQWDLRIRIFPEIVSGCILSPSEINSNGLLMLQGCISISLSLHQTSFCFVCSHLASGEKEGDELKRNADVAEMLKSIQFPNVCKNPNRKIPERIIDHE